jgi:hypothetical protein
MRIVRIVRIRRIVRNGARDRPPRPQKSLLLSLHRRAIAPHGAIRMIRSIRYIRIRYIRIRAPFLWLPDVVFGRTIGRTRA